MFINCCSTFYQHIYQLFFINCLSTFYQLYYQLFINFLSTFYQPFIFLSIFFIKLLNNVYQLFIIPIELTVYHHFVLSAWPLGVQLLVLPNAKPHLPQWLLQPPRTMVAFGRTNSVFVAMAGLVQRQIIFAGIWIMGPHVGGT